MGAMKDMNLSLLEEAPIDPAEKAEKVEDESDASNPYAWSLITDTLTASVKASDGKYYAETSEVIGEEED